MTRFSILLAFALLMAFVGPVQAQDADPVDPEAGSPSGFTYSIPLDEARQDAAPGGAGGGGDRAPVHSGGDPGAGFGSTPQVPGATDDPAPAEAPADTREAAGDGDATAGGRDRNGTGRGGRDGRGETAGSRDRDGRGEGAGQGDAPEVTTASVGGPDGSDSTLLPLGLLALALAVGGGFAALALRGRRASRR